MKNFKLWSIAVLSAFIFTGCATTTPKQNRDLSAYHAMMPKSILVLPPLNESPDTRAVNSYWSTVTRPIAEAGYYVFPIAVVDTMFKENGVYDSYQAQSLSPAKLQEIFGADAALYITVKEYGSKYQVLQTVNTVSVEGKLVDLKSGTVLWEGKEKQQQAPDNSNAGLIGALVGALIDQVSNHLQDSAYGLSNSVSFHLFTPSGNQQKGLLPGPRSPSFHNNQPVQ